MPSLSASEVVFHEEALYKEYTPLLLYLLDCENVAAYVF